MPTPAAAALAVAAATDAQGRRRALRELDAAVGGHARRRQSTNAPADRAVGIAAGISLVRGIRGNRADAAHQRAVPCDIEEAGAKGTRAFMRRAGFRASTPPLSWPRDARERNVR